MKNQALLIFLLFSGYCLQAQKHIGKTKGEILLEKSDCIYEFVNAFTLVAKCEKGYEEFQFNGGLKDSKNNRCSQESYEVDSSYIPILKKTLKESYADAKFYGVLKQMPPRIKSDSTEKVKLPVEFMEAGGMVIEVMQGDAHGNTGRGIYTLVFYISLKQAKSFTADSVQQQKQK